MTGRRRGETGGEEVSARWLRHAGAGRTGARLHVDVEAADEGTRLVVTVPEALLRDTAPGARYVELDMLDLVELLLDELGRRRRPAGE